MMTASGSGSSCPSIEGTLWTWGKGEDYLGHNASHTTDVSEPTQVGSATDWTNNVGQWGQGVHHVIKENGTLWTWGGNSYGACGMNEGDHSTHKYSSPVQVGSDTDWALCSVAKQSGEMAAFIKTDGTLWTVGRSYHGGLGHGDTTNRSSPTQVGSGTDYASVRCADAYYTMVLKTDGTLWGFGVNRQGNLGDNNTTADGQSTPVQAGSATNWLAFECGGRTVGGFVVALASA